MAITLQTGGSATTVQQPMIAELCNISKSYTVAGGRELKVLDQIDLAFRRGIVPGRRESERGKNACDETEPHSVMDAGGARAVATLELSNVYRHHRRVGGGRCVRLTVYGSVRDRTGRSHGRREYRSERRVPDGNRDRA